MDSTIEFDHCREVALQPGSLFEFTSQFLPAETIPHLFAIYALKQSVCDIPHLSVDDAVKWGKLKWWGEELLADPGSPSRHPIVRALTQSGARDKLDNSLLISLVGDSVQQVDAAPDSSESAMFDRFSEIGQAEIQLELALDDAEVEPRNLKFLSAASTLFGVVSSFSPGQRSQAERLPLSSLAKYGVTGEALEQERCSNELEQIIKDMVLLGLEWYSAGFDDLLLSSSSAANNVPGLHLRLRWAMERRQLMSIQKGIAKFFTKGMRYGPVDALFAWRFLRHLK